MGVTDLGGLTESKMKSYFPRKITEYKRADSKVVQNMGTLLNCVWEWSEFNTFEKCEDNWNQGRGKKIPVTEWNFTGSFYWRSPFKSLNLSFQLSCVSSSLTKGHASLRNGTIQEEDTAPLSDIRHSSLLPSGEYTEATNLSESGQTDWLTSDISYYFFFFFLISSRWHNPQKQFRPFSAMANYLSMNQVQIWHAFRCIPFHANPTPFSRFQWAAWSFVHSCCGEIVSRFRLQALLLHAYFYSLRKYPQA